MKKILIYSNLAGNANTPIIEDYLSLLKKEHDVHFESSYYMHDSNDHSVFDITFACIDTGYDIESAEMRQDVYRRIQNITKKGAKIVLVNLWESAEHIKSTDWFTLTKEHDPLVLGGGLSFFWWKMYHRYKNHRFKFYHSTKNFDFLYLNKTQRTHRDLLFDKLTKNNLLKNTLFSYHARGIRLDKRYELPWVDAENYPSYGHDRDIYEPQFNETKFNIVSETRTDGDIFITEKTWKPIMAKQLFILHGQAHLLKELRGLGFQTYHDHMDESYDSMEDLDQRTDAIVKLCESLKGKPHIWLYADTKEIREHNRNIFFSEQHLRDACRKDLKILFELIDRSQISS